MTNTAGEPLEIERKFLIRMPAENTLRETASRILSICQIYLRKGESGGTARIRRITENGSERFFFTEKQHITDAVRIEREREISREEYDSLVPLRDPERRTIRKTRYCVPFGGHTLEIDVFPFWSSQAYCEIELTDADEEITMPGWLEVLREVTADRRYTNSALALNIPPEG